jgi:hypothetical protein
MEKLSRDSLISGRRIANLVEYDIQVVDCMQCGTETELHAVLTNNNNETMLVLCSEWKKVFMIR